MDAIRKQASKFREQVAKQQQAVLKQFTGYAGSPGDLITDEAELQRHQQLERLYISTRAGKHFQREIVRGIDGFISAGSKQLEISTKLAEDCCKYATEGPNPSGGLARASNIFGGAILQMEKERDTLHRVLGTQVAEPLRAMVMGAPLEDARHLCQRYDRLRQEAEAQAIEVGRRQLKSKEAGGNVDNAFKLQAAETKLTDLTSAMATLGKEAAAAMIAVEAQQQRLTLQRLITMVEAERVYHQRSAEILDQLHTQMVAERQRSEATPSISALPEAYVPPPSYDEIKSNGPDVSMLNSGASATQKAMFFLAEVIHSFEAETAGELSLSMGDYVVVRQVSPTGWSEGESKGKCGWFPTSHVVRRQRAPASKVVEAGSLL